MAEKLICTLCGQEAWFRWSDTHGIGVHSCGMPYTLYHYEGEGDERKRADKPPTPVEFLPGWLDIGRRYHKETGKRACPGEFDMGFLGGRETTYSGATEDDYRSWHAWLEAHTSELPVLPTPPEPTAPTEK